MTFSDNDISKFTGISQFQVTEQRRAEQRAKRLKPVARKPVALDLDGAVALCKALKVEMPEHALREWLESKKNARRPQDATVLRTRWRNPRILKARLKTTKETIRVRVKKASVFRPGATIQVLRESDYMFVLDPEWSPKRRKQATKGRVRV